MCFHAMSCGCLGPPSKKHGGQEVLHDSVIAKPGIPNGQIGGVQSHMEVVTYDPAQAYPEYILRYVEDE